MDPDEPMDPDELMDSGETSPEDPALHPPHVIVIGGGVAGLVSARTLLDAGVRVTLLEASDRLGGKLQPHVVGGIELDSGAESFATRGGTVAALIGSLGMSHALVEPAAGGAWLQPADGPALPLPKAGLLGIPSVPLARDVIAVVGLRGALRAQLDALMSGFPGSKEHSLGGLVRKRMGAAVLDRLVTPVAGSIHAAHPDDLEVDLVAPRLRAAVLSEGSLARAVTITRGSAPAGSAVQGLFGGVFLLAEALAADVGARAAVVFDTRVTAVTGTTVRSERDGVETVLIADGVVLAAPLDAAPGPPIVLVTLIVTTPGLDAAPRGTGVLVAPGHPSIRAKSLTHASAKWTWLADRVGPAHVLRVSYDPLASGHPPLDGVDLVEQAHTDAAAMLGVPIASTEVTASAVVDWTGPPAASAREHDGVGGDAVVRVGEAVAGAGLAGIIAHATQATENLLGDLRAAPALRWDRS